MFQFSPQFDRARRGILASLALAVLAVAGAAPASANDVNVSTGLTLAGGPLAIHGYDPVAYFTEDRARLGQAIHSAKHGNAVYRFVSAANKRKFEAEPERYLPQYGGFCAYGTALGAKFDGDPLLFTVVDGKLYFNLNPEILKKWRADIPGYIVKADRHWRRIRDKSPAELTD
ncbi:MAG: hypothetical protein GC160_14150 [Acidobacteria bacterium]|nr:hypothetical protein [Acidobacteriota bacterium]